MRRAPTARTAVFILEAVTDYKVFKYLNVGGGLHYNNGISRLTSPSTSTILPLDLPLVNFPTVDQIDQFARWLGVYARGRIGKFNYRLAVDEAFLTNLSSTPATLTTNVAEYNPRNTSHVYQGYFNYNFLEPEANLLPYFTGTYLGTKRVLSVGTGFLYNQDGMYAPPRPTRAPARRPVRHPTNQYDIKIFGADVFYDAPLGHDPRHGPDRVRRLLPQRPSARTTCASWGRSTPATAPPRGAATPFRRRARARRSTCRSATCCPKSCSAPRRACSPT